MDAHAPVAGRLRRPGWKDPRLMIGLLLMAVAIVGVTGIVQAADHTAAHYVARETLTPGTVLEPDDLAVARVRVGEGPYIAADGGTGAEPWGRVVTRVVEAGELVPAAALATLDSFDGRSVAVVTTSPVSADVRPGSVVDVWVTAADSAGRPDSLLVGESLVVADVAADEGGFTTGGGETVYVVVPRAALGDFLEALATDGDVSVVGLGGAP
ncbi:SAF domain-containing protein [Demequina sp. SO4-13]|uniref:SAF domain-containing protein n=1 Tax=Demequina sp. SO4-13 TaxID=3401027 RepID=UPI003AF5D973